MAPIMRYLGTLAAVLSLQIVPGMALPAIFERSKYADGKQLDLNIITELQCAAPPSECAQKTKDECKNEWYWETSKDQALTSAHAFCKELNLKAYNVEPGFKPVSQLVDGDKLVKEYTNANGVWRVSIEDVDDCKTDHGNGVTRHMHRPVAEYFCEDVLYGAWHQCDNKGRGGSVVVGCLKYTFTPMEPTDSDIKEWWTDGWHYRNGGVWGRRWSRN